MHLSFFSDYPWYFYLLALLLGCGISWMVYAKNDLHEKSGRFSFPVWLLMLLRALSVALLAILLIGPLVKNSFRKVIPPIVVIGLDDSRSILLTKDSAYYKTEFLTQLEKLRATIAQKYDVRVFHFGKEIKESANKPFTQSQTNISGYLDGIYNRYYNQNIGAVITLSDGIYNQGENPLTTAEKFNAPFYTVALGDTTIPRDIVLKEVLHNDIVYAGNSFPLEVQLRAQRI